MVDRVKRMSNISGRTTINVFDSEPIFARYSPLQLLEFMKVSPGLAESSYHNEIVVHEGSVNILKRPLDYTYKDTVTRALRSDDPVAIQKSRAEQLHNVEASIRCRTELFGPEQQKFVNFDY